jgi:hypothetical protein
MPRWLTANATINPIREKLAAFLQNRKALLSSAVNFAVSKA